MTYLLDTNAVIALLRNRPNRVRERLRAAIAARALIVVSAIALFELWYGVARSQHQRENAERLRVFLSGAIDVVSFDQEDAAIAGDLRATLERAGAPIGPFDMLIAAQALRLRATLVTANVSEFVRIEGLNWQDWSSDG